MVRPQIEIDLCARLQRLAEHLAKNPPVRPLLTRLGMRIPGLAVHLCQEELRGAMLRCWSAADFAVCDLAERMLGETRCGELLCDALVPTGHYVRAGVDELRPRL